MSYYPDQQHGGGYPPPQGQAPPPQQGQGYGQPPNQYPPPSHSPYPPQQQGYGQPPMQNQQYPPPQGYGQQYPPQQQHYGQPPLPNQYAPPQGQPPYGAPPGQYPPQQQQWGQQPPPNQYGAPPGQPAYGAPPPGQYPPQGYPPQQPQFGAPPPGQYGAPMGYPTPPSPGYGPPQNMHIDVTPHVEAIYKAMKGFGTNEKALIQVLSKLDPIQMNAVREQFSRRYHEDLVARLEKETSGDFEKTLVHLARGPLIGDCWALKNAMKGLGTKEAILNDVLVGRSNADMNAIKTEYQRIHRTTLENDLKGDLSAATEQMFLMIVAARRNEDSDPVNPQQVDADVRALQQSFGTFVSKNAVQACQILTSKNDAQIRAISESYQRQYGTPFAQVLKKAFSGHMEDALLLLVSRAQNRAVSDAEQLEDSMAGIGTKDTLLIQRVIRAHWDRQHMQHVRQAYQTRFKKDLVRRIKGETSGDYERLLVACVE